jgi:propionyl-CoA carboxylase alpha chain
VQLGAQGQHVHHPVRLHDFEAERGTAEIWVAGRSYRIESHTPLGAILMTGRVNGQPFEAQIERLSGKQPLAMRLAHNGTRIDALVLLPRAAELFKLMPYKAPPDQSKFLLSPMPGLLAAVFVVPGQRVLAGERLAIIEAMKMENVLVAAQDGVVKDVRAGKGDSLSVDQAILAFE